MINFCLYVSSRCHAVDWTLLPELSDGISHMPRAAHTHTCSECIQPCNTFSSSSLSSSRSFKYAVLLGTKELEIIQSGGLGAAIGAAPEEESSATRGRRPGLAPQATREWVCVSRASSDAACMWKGQLPRQECRKRDARWDATWGQKGPSCAQRGDSKIFCKGRVTVYRVLNVWTSMSSEQAMIRAFALFQEPPSQIHLSLSGPRRLG